MKPIAFVGGALDGLRDFPASAHREAGYQLDRVQRGLDPDDWKPMTSVGPGVRDEEGRLPRHLHRSAARGSLRLGRPP
jgi:phage-related protein